MRKPTVTSAGIAGLRSEISTRNSPNTETGVQIILPPPPGRQSYLSAPGFPIKFSLLYSKFELSSMSYFIVALVKELTLYPMTWFMDGTPIDSIYLCPTIIQQMVRNRMPCKHVSVSPEDFVTSSFLPLVYSENEKSISLLGSET
jgi:hypothetical protein